MKEEKNWKYLYSKFNKKIAEYYEQYAKQPVYNSNGKKEIYTAEIFPIEDRIEIAYESILLKDFGIEAGEELYWIAHALRVSPDKEYIFKKYVLKLNVKPVVKVLTHKLSGGAEIIEWTREKERG